MPRKPTRKESLRVPPYSEEAEKGVLGSILFQPKMFRKCSRTDIRPSAFYMPAHNLIYTAMQEVDRDRKMPDCLLVANKLRDKGDLDKIGGMCTLEKLIDAVSTPAHLGHYIDIVQRKAKRRDAIILCRDSERLLFDSTDPEEDLLSKINFGFHKLGFIDKVSESILDIAQRIQVMYKAAKRTGVVGLKSRWFDFQGAIHGYKPGKITMVAARPAQGKTTFCLNEALYSALLRIPVLIVSIEMSLEEVVTKLICDLMGLDSTRFDDGITTPEEEVKFAKGGEILATLPIYMEHGRLTVEQISALVRDHVEAHGIKLCIIDYIQIVASTPGVKFQNRNLELTHMSQNILHLGNETKVHFLVASQLSRYEGSGKFKVKEPELHHLRDCGALEQDAFMVMFIYQDPDETEVWDDNAPTVFKIGKIRGASECKVAMLFEKTKSRFTGKDGQCLQDLLKDQFSIRPLKKESEVPF